MQGKDFIKKIIIIAFALVLVDWGIGHLLHDSYSRLRNGEQGLTNYMIDSCRAETIILGSSRAAHHYVPQVLSEYLQTTCFNGGKDKQRLRYCLAILEIVFKKYSPKNIILDLTPTAFEKSEEGLDELSILLPYYRQHPEIQHIVNERNRFEWLKTYSRLYCFNSLPLKIIFNRFSNQKYEQNNHGYIPLELHKEFIPDSPELLPSTNIIDSNLVKCFQDIIAIAKQNHSNLYVVVSPIYYQIPNDNKTIELASAICREEKIPFMNFTNPPGFISHGAVVFVDRDHLNDSSANLFSNMLGKEIKDYRK